MAEDGRHHLNRDCTYRRGFCRQGDRRCVTSPNTEKRVQRDVDKMDTRNGAGRHPASELHANAASLGDNQPACAAD
jgi:hypothetical protein